MNALVLAPLLLVAVLAVSGIAKLRDDTWQPEVVTRMGVPQALAHPLLVKALPWAELALAALLFAPGRWSLVGAVPATLLMLGYVVVVVHALRTIAHPTCHCFGQLTEGEVTATTVARNVTLTVIGLVAVLDALTGGGITRRAGAFGAQDWAWLLGTLAVAGVLWLVLGQTGRRVEETGVTGEVLSDEDLEYHRLPIPFGALRDLDDRPHQLRELSRRGAVLLLFLSQGCSACTKVVADLPDFQRRLPGLDVRVVLVGANPQAARDSGLVDPLLDANSEVYRMFAASGVPMAVLLGADGLLAGGPVAGSRAVAELVDDIEAELSAAEGLGADDADALVDASP